MGGREDRGMENDREDRYLMVSRYLWSMREGKGGKGRGEVKGKGEKRKEVR